MELSAFIEIGIVGVALSLVIQGIKARFGPSSFSTKVITVALSVLLGGAFFFLQGTPIFTSIVSILGFATVFYAYFLK